MAKRMNDCIRDHEVQGGRAVHSTLTRFDSPSKEVEVSPQDQKSGSAKYEPLWSNAFSTSSSPSAREPKLLLLEWDIERGGTDLRCSSSRKLGGVGALTSCSLIPYGPSSPLCIPLMAIVSTPSFESTSTYSYSSSSPGAEYDASYS